MMKHFRTPTYRWMRTSLFLAMGLSGIIPIGHGILTFGLTMALKSISLGYMIAMGAFYVVGALIYGNRYVIKVFPNNEKECYSCVHVHFFIRIPERWYPGKFNIWVCKLKTIHPSYVLLSNFFHYLSSLQVIKFSMSLLSLPPFLITSV
jgi:adiponectin receptor